MPRTPKLSDLQRVVLAHPAKRGDRHVVPLLTSVTDDERTRTQITDLIRRKLLSEVEVMLAGNVLPALEQRSTVLAGKLRERDHTTIRALLTAVRVLPDRFDLVLSRAALAEALGLHAPDGGEQVLTHSVALRLTRTGRAMRLVQDNGQAVTPAPPADTRSLVRLLARARQWWKLLQDTGLEIKVLAAREGVTASYMTRVVRLAFLSPRVVEAALAGALRTGVDVSALLAPGAIGSEWAEQERRFLPMQVGCPFR